MQLTVNIYYFSVHKLLCCATCAVVITGDMQYTVHIHVHITVTLIGVYIAVCTINQSINQGYVQYYVQLEVYSLKPSESTRYTYS